MNKRLRGVLAKLGDAREMTAHVQKEWREDRRISARCNIAHMGPKMRQRIEWLLAGGSSDVRLWIEEVVRTTTQCVYCDRPLVPRTVSIDHVIPLSKGGTHTKGNIVGCCLSCNCSKGNKLDWVPPNGRKMRRPARVVVIDWSED